jgi:hypothetical protein
METKPKLKIGDYYRAIKQYLLTDIDGLQEVRYYLIRCQ